MVPTREAKQGCQAEHYWHLGLDEGGGGSHALRDV